MYYQDLAIILKRENFREDDLLITCYSKEKGKIKLQAKGAKKIKSKLAAHLEPIDLSNLNITKGKNIDQLIGARVENSFQSIKSDLITFGYASYFLELINKLVGEGDKDSKIFVLLEKALNFLENKNKLHIVSNPNTFQHGAIGIRGSHKSYTVRSYQQTSKQMGYLPSFARTYLSIGSIARDNLAGYVLARISFGFKLLDLLGFNPSEKNIKLKKEIRFIIKNGLEEIFVNENVAHNLVKLNKILDKEFRLHLNHELNSEEFLKQVI